MTRFGLKAFPGLEFVLDDGGDLIIRKEKTYERLVDFHGVPADGLRRDNGDCNRDDNPDRPLGGLERQEEQAMTNADAIRQMTDEELLEEIYRLQGNATACVACWEKTGKERLRLYLGMEAEAFQKRSARQSPWHTGTPTESGEYLVCIRYDFGKEGYTTANYVEPYNPHTGWYNLKPPSEISADEWCKKKGIEVIAWQKIEPYKEEK